MAVSYGPHFFEWLYSDEMLQFLSFSEATV
jgi:hypothetical protein